MERATASKTRWVAFDRAQSTFEVCTKVVCTRDTSSPAQLCDGLPPSPDRFSMHASAHPRPTRLCTGSCPSDEGQGQALTLILSSTVSSSSGTPFTAAAGPFIPVKLNLERPDGANQGNDTRCPPLSCSTCGGDTSFEVQQQTVWLPSLCPAASEPPSARLSTQILTAVCCECVCLEGRPCKSPG